MRIELKIRWSQYLQGERGHLPANPSSDDLVSNFFIFFWVSPQEFCLSHLHFFSVHQATKLGSAHIDLHQSHPAKLPLRLEHSFRNNQEAVWLKQSTYSYEDRIFFKKKQIHYWDNRIHATSCSSSKSLSGFSKILNWFWQTIIKWNYQ